MTTIIRVIILSLTVVLSTVNAQDFQGVATYRTQRSFKIKMDSTKVNDAMQAQMMEMMKKQFQKTYILTFDKSASVYQQEKELAKPSVGMSGNFEVSSFGGSGGSDIFYKDTKRQTYVDQKETMGKKFLIKDSISPIDWQLGSESKYIGEYLCFKATYIRQVPKMEKMSFSTNSDEGDEDTEPEMENLVVSAWYTTQIPVNNGPAIYQGLPGLILAVHDGKLNIICSKIVINPDDKIKIEAPTKGKEVDQKTYDVIMDKKRKDMMERYAPKRGGKSGEVIEIRIGG